MDSNTVLAHYSLRLSPDATPIILVESTRSPTIEPTDDGRHNLLLLLLAVRDNAAMEAEPKRKRRWFQFSLRSLLIFTVIVAIPCAWLGRRIERKGQEREAAVWLVRRKDKDRKLRKLLKRAAKLRKKSDKLADKQLRVQAESDLLLEKLRRLRISQIPERGESRRPESASNT